MRQTTNKKWWSFLFIIAMTLVLLPFAHFTAFAEDADLALLQETKPDSTTLNIYKLQAEDYGVGVPKEHDGHKLTDQEIQALGTSVKGIAGVTFTYFKIKGSTESEIEINLAAIKADTEHNKTVEGMASLAANIVSTTGTNITATSDEGLATVTLPDGTYWFVEKARPDTVSSELAVPFVIELPAIITKNIGTEDSPNFVSRYRKVVNIYPKNTAADLPKGGDGDDATLKKTIDDLTKNESSHHIGEEFYWYISSEMPKNIQDYKKFELSDTLDTKLDLVDNSVEVYLATEDEMNKLIANQDGKPTVEVVNTFYTYTKETNAGDEHNQTEIKVALKIANEKVNSIIANKIKAATGKKLYVRFKTKVNKNAVMGKDIPNKAKLTFNNGSILHKEDRTVETGEKKVHTGGKLFKKVDATNTGTVLQDAKFIISVSENGGGNTKYLKQDDSTKAITWLDGQAEATVFVTQSNGIFAVTGLAYTDDKHQYKLIETIAPVGYAVNRSPIAFTVDKNSYHTTPDTIDAENGTGDAEALVVKNKKLVIPQTGGIGTMIFIIGGLVLMAGAFIALKKSEETN